MAEHVYSQDAGTGPASAAAGVPDEQAGVSAATGSAVPACQPVCKPAHTVSAQCRPSGEGDRLAASRAATAALPALPPQAVQANQDAVQQTTTAFRLPQESPWLRAGVHLGLTAEATSPAQQEPTGLPADLQLRLAAGATPAAQRLPPVAHLGGDAAPIHSRTRAHFNLQHVTLDDLEKALPPLPPEQPWQPELAPQQQDDMFYQSFLQVRRPKLCPAPCLLAVLILCTLLGMPAFGLPSSNGIKVPGKVQACHLRLHQVAGWVWCWTRQTALQVLGLRHSSKDCNYLPGCRLAGKVYLQSSCAFAWRPCLEALQGMVLSTLVAGPAWLAWSYQESAARPPHCSALGWCRLCRVWTCLRRRKMTLILPLRSPCRTCQRTMAACMCP